MLSILNKKYIRVYETQIIPLKIMKMKFYNYKIKNINKKSLNLIVHGNINENRWLIFIIWIWRRNQEFKSINKLTPNY